MNKKIVLLICMLLLSVGLLSGCIEEERVDNEDFNSVKQITATYVLGYEACYNYSSDGLREAIDDHKRVTADLHYPVLKECNIYIPEGNLIVYGEHNNTNCSFYFKDISYLTFGTAGLNYTRFIVFENKTVFGFNNVSNCRFHDLNFTVINDMPTIISFEGEDNTMSEMNVFDGVMAYQNISISKYWYDAIQYFCNENPGGII